MPSTFTHTFDTLAFKGVSTFSTGLFINGQFVDPVENGTHPVVNPINKEIITNISVGSGKDVDIAVAAARTAFKSTWGLNVPASTRRRAMNKLADLIEDNIDEFTALEVLNTGKPFHITKAFEISAAVETIRYYAGFADKVGGKTIEPNPAKMAYTRHEPLGVVGQIIPWNIPLMSITWKICPALATGNCVVLKPSEITPLTALKLASLVNAAGFPPGVLNIVNGLGTTVGQALSEHYGINKVAFTGSTATGRRIMEASSRTNLKPVSLELGGKSPTIIFDDANLEQAMKWTANSIFFNTGQTCAAGSRIFVQEGVYDEFVGMMVAAAEALRIGDPFDAGTNFGPQIHEAQYDRVISYINKGKAEGGKVLIGGASYGSGGFHVRPTLFTECTPGMTIAREEIFGPVGVIFKFKDEAEVIEQANDTIYGLACNIFTKDMQRGLKTAHAIDSGSHWINFASIPDATIPFGGYKQSGFGRDLGEDALEMYTQVKAIHINLSIEL